MLYNKKETNFRKNNYETKWQIKMKWSWLRTIILMYNKNARDELSSETVMIMHIILYKCLSRIKGNIKINITEKNAGAWRPTVAGWGGPTPYYLCGVSIVFCLDYPILPYALSFYWHFVLRPLHFTSFFKGFHPPGTTRVYLSQD